MSLPALGKDNGVVALDNPVSESALVFNNASESHSPHQRQVLLPPQPEMLIAFCCSRVVWKCLGMFTAGRQNPRNFPFTGKTGQKAGAPALSCADCCATDSHSLPASVLHPSPCPCITASRGPYFLLRFESRRGPVCHHLGETSWEVHSSGGRQQLRPPGNGAMHKGRFTAPLPFRHFMWSEAELTAPHF